MWPFASSSDARKLLHHKVEVLTTQNKRLTGWIYTVDPRTDNFVVYGTNSDGAPLITILMARHIQELKILQDPTEEVNQVLDKLFLNTDEVSYSEQELLERKERMINWLEQNRLPVNVDGDKLIIAEALDILPPYTKRSCQSRNQIMLLRVQAIIEAMPEK